MIQLLKLVVMEGRSIMMIQKYVVMQMPHQVMKFMTRLNAMNAVLHQMTIQLIVTIVQQELIQILASFVLKLNVLTSEALKSNFTSIIHVRLTLP